ncbi:Cobalamin (Vitamin B12) biosynthesis CbiX protein [Defluviimonas sp. 20V17]|uniref:Sirohydrochlorin ferrochelatase n=1 Tax=Allgaiera indica TaxID=765699 RepID=A0AAN4UQC0_9RHOB|nr:CbiX/SirB N-terminal domain-containing protein [Allgaiera indica]KDB03241.1 Cobalamin (Vitamin B12) biosynthesis CbiX protein [Defluviimonas sp. 20V17]GHE00665.1 hypothetical protein GCM10008024_13090 [Allgaiera indica]SDW57976.1 Sirohydrochlorin ferrochelatase [Allgaiera indica]
MTRSAVLVAHGAPSDPATQERAMADLAARVGALLPDWRLRGATLAAPGALEHAMDGLDAPLIYPFFMSAGWFTTTELPRRLILAGKGGARCLAPFGADPGLPDLARAAAEAGAAAVALDPARATLLLAAHGSSRPGAVARASARAAAALARRLATRAFARVEVGLIEEAPSLTEVARAARSRGPGLCLPLFAQAAGHVRDDVPRALFEAGFTGLVLAPIGAHPKVPALIAGALAQAE